MSPQRVSSSTNRLEKSLEIIWHWVIAGATMTSRLTWRWPWKKWTRIRAWRDAAADTQRRYWRNEEANYTVHLDRDPPCIVQNNENEQRKEFTLMGQYYQLSRFTIAATYLRDGSIGCFSNCLVPALAPLRYRSADDTQDASKQCFYVYAKEPANFKHASLLKRLENTLSWVVGWYYRWLSHASPWAWHKANLFCSERWAELL